MELEGLRVMDRSDAAGGDCVLHEGRQKRRELPLPAVFDLLILFAMLYATSVLQYGCQWLCLRITRVVLSVGREGLP
jgi:hypothetical protein